MKCTNWSNWNTTHRFKYFEKNNARNTNYFIKKIYKLLMWWMIISKWKNDINDGSKWISIRD